MGQLTHGDFGAFFRALWSFDPFPWQQALVRRLAGGEGWPGVLDLPTGSGKTAALDIALFHLALEADKGEQRRAPVRIAFVVDRRLIVDDAHARAERLSAALSWSLLDHEEAKELEARKPELAGDIRRVRGEPVVKRAALQLRKLAGIGEQPLVARRLRGGAPREDDWARTPVQPTILCSTVDQVGSRLLFRGYGVSDAMKPVHAGLLGSDCLLLLDEAHLSEPFRQTLHAIKRLRAPDTAPFGFALLTATPQREEEGESKEAPFGLSAADRDHQVLSRRLAAKKPARLEPVSGKEDGDAEPRRVEAIVSQTRRVLEGLKASGVAHPAVGVVVNRVGRARAAFERLRNELDGTAEVILLIGPARAADREERVQKLDAIRTGRDARGALDLPLIVVATQTIEAGVDIDFDGLVTEAAALDALRQRFGRLNRAGRAIRPEAVILAHKDDLKPGDPVYGDRIKTTWEKLQELVDAAGGTVDFGIAALRSHLDGKDIAALSAPTSDAPVLMPAYAHLWSHTSPIPNADPEVALFLHGPDRSPASVQIVWRADIDEARDLKPEDADKAKAARSRLIELLKLVPPRAAEAVEVPLWAARAWLDQGGGDLARFSDAVEHAVDADAQADPRRRAAFRWAGEDSDRTGAIFGRGLCNGDLIVVTADYGGCDEWGWNPESRETVVDVADKAAEPYRARRFAVRVTPALIAQQAAGTDAAVDRVAIAERLSELLAKHESDRKADAVLDAVLDLPMLPGLMKERLQKLQPPKRGASGQQERRKGPLEAELDVYGRDAGEQPTGIVFTAPRGLDAIDGDGNGAAVPATESDELGASGGWAVLLADHSGHVGQWASMFAERAGLPSAICEDVSLSGFLHDPGKADPRWQAYAMGGNPYGPDLTDALAKPGKRPPRDAWARAGLPPHWRHEALSVRLARLHPEFEKAHDRLLVLWLIGTHHGHGRPLFPHADLLDAQRRNVELPRALGGKVALSGGHGPQSLAFDFEGRDWAQMFDELKERYGIWGLARLEVLVRLADHRASEMGAPPTMAAPRKEAAE